MPFNAVEVPLRSTMFADPSLITYELIFSGAEDMLETKHFIGSHANEAITQASLKIVEFNNNPNVRNAYVILSRLPDEKSSVGRNILTWTKPYMD